jgi:hypothetical protein
MFKRLISCGVLVLGAALFGTGCSPTAEAQQSSALEEEDPNDSCDPAQGGADCGGICQKAPKKPVCDDPNRVYVSKDPDQCAAIRFVCDPGQVAFFDECGCGCETQ